MRMKKLLMEILIIIRLMGLLILIRLVNIVLKLKQLIKLKIFLVKNLML